MLSGARSEGPLRHFTYVQPVLKLGITPWNPQAGLTLAFLLVYGPRWASVTAVAVLLSEILVRQNSVASSLVIGVSMWIALGYGVLAALLRRWRLETPIRTLVAALRCRSRDRFGRGAP